MKFTENLEYFIDPSVTIEETDERGKYILHVKREKAEDILEYRQRFYGIIALMEKIFPDQIRVFEVNIKKRNMTIISYRDALENIRHALLQQNRRRRDASGVSSGSDTGV